MATLLKGPTMAKPGPAIIQVKHTYVVEIRQHVTWREGRWNVVQMCLSLSVDPYYKSPQRCRRQITGITRERKLSAHMVGTKSSVGETQKSWQASTICPPTSQMCAGWVRPCTSFHLSGMAAPTFAGPLPCHHHQPCNLVPAGGMGEGGMQAHVWPPAFWCSWWEYRSNQPHTGTNAQSPSGFVSKEKCSSEAGVWGTFCVEPLIKALRQMQHQAKYDL